MGHQVPAAWLDGIRKFVLASNFPLTAFLFTRLFQNDLARIRKQPLLHVLELLYLPMFAAALLLPYRYFIPMLWLGSFIGYGIIVYYLGNILLVSRSRIALWFSASLVVTAAAGFAEVIKAMFSLPGPIPYVNSITAALSSGLLVAMALAEQMRIERSGRQGAELALQKTYDQVPVAFFIAERPAGRQSARTAALPVGRPRCLVRGTRLDRRRADRRLDRGHHRSRHRQPQTDVPGGSRPAHRCAKPACNRAGTARRNPLGWTALAHHAGLHGS